MANIDNFITENIDVWSSATKRKSVQGRGSNKKTELYGIKKLRVLILELAMRGQLLNQNPDDIDASNLLVAIENNKRILEKNGGIKKQNSTLDIIKQNIPFEIPSNWVWVTLGTLLDRISNGASGKQNKSNDGFPVTRIETISESVINFDKLGYINNIPKEKQSYYKLIKGDILLSHINSDYHVGKTAIYEADETLYHGVNLLLLRPNKFTSAHYINLAINQLRLSGYFLTIAQHAIGQSSINQTKVNECLIPLPPLAEQERIVAKVDELMALCDQLEQQQENSITAHKTLVETLLAALTNSANNKSFEEAWQRISENFDVLLTTEDSIEQLKQTILQLAVMGKLVHQNLNEEPANVLLRKIAKEKSKLVLNNKIKQQAKIKKFNNQDMLFKIPTLWSWCYLGDILEMISDYHANGAYKKLKENVQLLEKEDYAIMLRTTNFSEKNFNNYKYISEHAYNFLTKSKLYSGDIIMNKIGDPGAVFFVEDRGKPMSLAMNLFLLRTLGIESRYAHIYLVAFYEHIKSFAAGTSTQTITKDAVNELAFPLAPLEEQKRIVAKVDELMALCEQLKSQINKSQKTQLQLADAITEQAIV